MKLLSLPEIKSRVSSWVTGKGWREAWAAGNDTGGGFASKAGACPDPASQSAWVFACLRLICDQVRSVPMEMTVLDASGQDIPWTDAETQKFWARPAKTASGRLSLGDFLELSACHVKLSGQAFWVLDDTWLSPGGIKSPVMLARPDRMSPIMRGDVIMGWMLIDGSASRHVLLPEQVIRPRNLHPWNDAEGLSALEAARIAVDSDYAAAVYQRNVAASNGDQGVYVVAKGGAALSNEQREQIIAQLRQKAQESRRGNFRPAFLTADVSIEDPKMKTVDVAFLDGRASSRDEIAVAFGVPPSMMQASTSQSIGRASDRYAFIENAVMPLAAKLCEGIAEIERRRSSRMVQFMLNWNVHPVMRAAREESMKACADLWRTGVPWIVLNDMSQLNMKAFPGWEASWLPMSMERVEEKAVEVNVTPPTKRVTNEVAVVLTERGKLIAELEKAVCTLTAGSEKPHAPGCSCCAPGCKSAEEDAPRDPKRVKLWQKHMAARGPSEKLMLSKCRKVIMAARSEMLAKLESSEKALSGIRQRGVLDVMFDLAEFTVSMIRETKAAGKEALTQALMQFAEEIGADDPWKVEDARLFTFMSQRENLIRDASRRVWEDIKSEVEEGLRSGESNAQISDRVRAAFNGISKDRANAIAATEVGAAYGFARHESMQGLGIEEKEWLASGLDTVRDSHRIADGQRVPVDEPFMIRLKDGGEEPMMFPGDPAGSAENVINCKCVVIAVGRGD